MNLSTAPYEGMQRLSTAAGIASLSDSRAATDALLGLLRQGGWSPRACLDFLALTADRSVRQAARRPRALAEITALHGAVLTLSRGRRRGWVAASWLLAATHLGLLEGRDRLAPADWLTLCRANLPALDEQLGHWSGAVAIATDLADGRLARHQRTVSPFGAYADHLADAAFWTWLTLRHEPDRRLRAAAIAAWAAPALAVTALSAARGRMVDPPGPALLRPAAAMQAVIALRRVTAGRRHQQG